MSYFPHGALVAIHAAQEQRKQDEEEELQMTRYSTDELDSDWEFKIVRSETGAFRRPEVFAALLQEESLAGWEMVEKLDDRRVRFKRRSTARRGDGTLPPRLDPYRTQYGGASSARKVVLVMIALLLSMGVVFGVFFGRGSSMDSPIPVIAIMIGVIVLIFMFVAIVAVRRSQ